MKKTTKRILLSFIGLFLIGFINAQKLTADDLISISNCNSVQSLKKIMTINDYTFSKNLSSKAKEWHTYFFKAHKKADNKINKYNTLIYSKYRTTTSSIINFKIYDSEYCKLLISQFEQKSFSESENKLVPYSNEVILNLKSTIYPDLAITIHFGKVQNASLSNSDFEIEIRKYSK